MGELGHDALIRSQWLLVDPLMLLVKSPRLSLVFLDGTHDLHILLDSELLKSVKVVLILGEVLGKGLRRGPSLLKLLLHHGNRRAVYLIFDAVHSDSHALRRLLRRDYRVLAGRDSRLASPDAWLAYSSWLEVARAADGGAIALANELSFF